LLITRFTRLFAYGALSIVLVIYLTGLGFSESRTGTLLTLTLLGDAIISLWLTTRADRFGRRRTLIIGAILMAAAGVTFAVSNNMLLLIVAGTIVLSVRAATRSGHSYPSSKRRFRTLLLIEFERGCSLDTH